MILQPIGQVLHAEFTISLQDPEFNSCRMRRCVDIDRAAEAQSAGTRLAIGFQGGVGAGRTDTVR